MKKLTLTLDETNWLEATWFENDIQVHCESYSGHREHIAMLRDKAKEFDTNLDEYEDLIKQAEDAYVYPTYEEIKAQELAIKLAEAKAYLASTDYKMLPNYVPKANEDLAAIIVKRNETREFIRNNNA